MLAKDFLHKEDAKSFLHEEDAKSFLHEEDAKSFLHEGPENIQYSQGQDTRKFRQNLIPEGEDSWGKVIGKSAVQGTLAMPKLVSEGGHVMRTHYNMPESEFRKAIKKADAFWQPKVGKSKAKNIVGQSVRVLVEMATTGAVGRARGILPLLSARSGAEKAAQTLDEGYKMDVALTAGVIQAAVEYLTERFPIGILLKPGIGFIKRLAAGAVTDIAGEVVATATEMALIDEELLGKKYSKEHYEQAIFDTIAVAGLTTFAATTAVHPFSKNIAEYLDKKIKAELQKIEKENPDTFESTVLENPQTPQSRKALKNYYRELELKGEPRGKVAGQPDKEGFGKHRYTGKDRGEPSTARQSAEAFLKGEDPPSTLPEKEYQGYQPDLPAGIQHEYDLDRMADNLELPVKMSTTPAPVKYKFDGKIYDKRPTTEYKGDFQAVTEQAPESRKTVHARVFKTEVGARASLNNRIKKGTLEKGKYEVFPVNGGFQIQSITFEEKESRNAIPEGLRPVFAKMRDELKVGQEGGLALPTGNQYGSEDAIRFKSSNPQWFRESGLSKEDVIRTINKAEKGVGLQAGEQKIYDLLIDQAKKGDPEITAAEEAAKMELEGPKEVTGRETADLVNEIHEGMNLIYAGVQEGGPVGDVHIWTIGTIHNGTKIPNELKQTFITKDVEYKSVWNAFSDSLEAYGINIKDVGVKENLVDSIVDQYYSNKEARDESTRGPRKTAASADRSTSEKLAEAVNKPGSIKDIGGKHLTEEQKIKQVVTDSVTTKVQVADAMEKKGKRALADKIKAEAIENGEKLKAADGELTERLVDDALRAEPKGPEAVAAAKKQLKGMTEAEKQALVPEESTTPESPYRPIEETMTDIGAELPEIIRPINEILADINKVMGQRGAVGDVKLTREQEAARKRIHKEVKILKNNAKRVGKEFYQYLVDMKIDPKVARVVADTAKDIPEDTPSAIKKIKEPQSKEEAIAEFEKDRTFANKIHEMRDVAEVEIEIETQEYQQEIQRLAGSVRGKLNIGKLISAVKGVKDTQKSRDLDMAMMFYRDFVRPHPEFAKKLREYLEKPQKGREKIRRKEYLKILNLAENLTLEQQNFVNTRMEMAFNKVRDLAIEDGIIKEGVENYVRRSFDLHREDAIPSFASTGFKVFTTAQMKRTLPTIADAIMKGYDLNIKSITNSYNAIASEIATIVANKQFIEMGKMAGIFTTKQQPNYKRLQANGFHEWVWAGKRQIKAPLYAPNNIANMLNSMTKSGSDFWHSKAARKALRFNSAIKGYILMSSFFHHMAGARSWAFGVTHGGPKGIWQAIDSISAHKRGLKKIKERAPVYMQAVKHGLTTGRMLDWSEQLMRDQEGFVESIVKNMGMEHTNQAIQWAGLKREQMANSLFKRYFAGLKVEAFAVEYTHRLQKAAKSGKPVNADLIAEQTARLINADFGGLHLKRMGRSPDVQNMLRLLLLAPDWTESNFRTFTGMVPGANKFIADRFNEMPPPPGMDKVYRNFWGGVIIKGVLSTLLLQLALNGPDDTEKFYKEQGVFNPVKNWDTFKKLKWAGVDVTKAYSALGADLPKGDRKVFSSLGHFTDPMKLIDPPKLIKGKASPLARLTESAMTGSDWAERPFTGMKELAKTGKTVKRSRYHKKEEFINYWLAWAANNFINMQPIQVGYMLKYFMGEEDGLTAILKSAGMHISTTHKKKRKRKKL